MSIFYTNQKRIHDLLGNFSKAKVIFIVTFMLIAHDGRATYQGQLVITPIDARGTPVFFCNGVRQNWLQLDYDIVNLNSSDPVHIDSVIMRGDSNSFSQFDQIFGVDTFTIGIIALMPGAIYAPQKTGQDTMWVTVYYGPYATTQAFYCEAIESPPVGLYGYTPYNYQYTPSFGMGGTHLQIEADTLHDRMHNNVPYLTSAKPQNTGQNVDVELHSCGGATIDSIYEFGDFSEFAFGPFPGLPYAMSGDDSLIITYEFTPRVVDTSGLNHHYLIFHSTDGHYLTWSFEYRVYPASSVSELANPANEIKVFPNPASDELQILGGEAGTARLFDLLGRERMDTNDDGSGASLDVSRLESGTYFLRLGSESAKVEIDR